MRMKPLFPGWAPSAIVASAMLLSACFLRRRNEAPPLAPALPVQQVEAPTSPDSRAVSDIADLVQEPYIESLIAKDSDVRLVLQRIAEAGNLELIIPGNIKKTISVQYIHVPVSVALNDVLARSGLRLGTGTGAPMPFDTVTVFYRLPANVDSLSADGIMKRFGLSRSMAELIVKSRPPER